jgi:hypothetical protein
MMPTAAVNGGDRRTREVWIGEHAMRRLVVERCKNPWKFRVLRKKRGRLAEENAVPLPSSDQFVDRCGSVLERSLSILPSPAAGHVTTKDASVI